MNKINRFALIYCNCQKPNKPMRSHYAGQIQIDTQNTVRFYCHSCHRLVEYTSDGEGGLTREVLPKDFKVTHESVAIQEVRHGRS